MELNGALSNPLETHKRLLALRSKLEDAGLPSPSAKCDRNPLPPRAGDTKAAVIEMFAEAPMTLKEIHKRCEALLGRPISYATVKDCVHKHARAGEAFLVRIRHGVYRQRR